LQLAQNDLLIIEGRGALGDWFFRTINPEDRYGIFVNVVPSLKVEGNQPLTSFDVRLMCEILDQHRTEGWSAYKTIRRWRKMRRTQVAKLYPRMGLTDYTFNAYLPYSLPILKHEIMPLLPSEDELVKIGHLYSIRTIGRLKNLLSAVEEADAVPAEVASVFKASSLGQFIDLDRYLLQGASTAGGAYKGDHEGGSHVSLGLMPLALVLGVPNLFDTLAISDPGSGMARTTNHVSPYCALLQKLLESLQTVGLSALGVRVVVQVLAEEPLLLPLHPRPLRVLPFPHHLSPPLLPQ